MTISKGELYQALAAAQGAFTPIALNRTATLPSMDGQEPEEFSYADLDELIRATRPALAANGLAVFQLPEHIDGRPYLTTTLAHSSGVEIKCSVPSDMFPVMDIMGYGGTLTFLRRYTYQSILCLAGNHELELSQRMIQAVAAPRTGKAGGKGAGKPPEQPKEEPALPALPPERIERDKAKWRASINNGALSVDDILTSLRTRYTVSADAEAAIKQAITQ